MRFEINYQARVAQVQGNMMERTNLLGTVTMLLALLGVGCIGTCSVSAVPQCVSVTMQPNVQLIAENMRQMSVGASELSFMQSMIRVDVGAIRMSEQAVSRATHPELRQFARHVVNARSAEQDTFLSWILTIYGDGAYSASKPMTEDSLTISTLDTCNCGFEVGYMLAMIKHDAGVLAIAGEAGRRTAHGRIRQAALNVTMGRSADITQLQKWLACWYGIKASVAGPRQCIQC